MQSLSEEQLSFFARHGFCEDPQPEPLPFGSSKLDTLDRKKLVELWQESERTHAQFATRSSEQNTALSDSRGCAQSILLISNDVTRR